MTEVFLISFLDVEIGFSFRYSSCFNLHLLFLPMCLFHHSPFLHLFSFALLVLALERVDGDLLVVLLQGGEVLAGLCELALLLALAHVPVGGRAREGEEAING